MENIGDHADHQVRARNLFPQAVIVPNIQGFGGSPGMRADEPPGLVRVHVPQIDGKARPIQEIPDKRTGDEPGAGFSTMWVTL